MEAHNGAKCIFQEGGVPAYYLWQKARKLCVECFQFRPYFTYQTCILLCVLVSEQKKNNNHHFRDRSSPMDCRSPLLSVKPCARSRALHLETRHVHAQLSYFFQYRHCLLQMYVYLGMAQVLTFFFKSSLLSKMQEFASM